MNVVVHGVTAKALSLRASAGGVLDFNVPLRARSLGASVAIALRCTAAAIFFREVVFFGSLGDRLVYLTFYVPIMVAALTGGLTAGALTAVLAALATTLWLAPPEDFGAWLGFAVFLLNGVLIVALTEAMRRTRTRALETQNRLHLLIEQASEGIFIADAQGHYIDVNSSGARMLGYSQEEIRHLAIADLVASDEISRVAPELAKLRSGETVVSEWHFRRRDGSYFLGEVSARQLSDSRMQAFVRDITERKSAEEALRESENRLRTVVELASDAIIVVDESGLIRSANPAAGRVFGYPPDDLSGRNINELVPGVDNDVKGKDGSDAADHNRKHVDTIDSGGSRKEGRRKDGSSVPLELTVATWKDAEGRRFFTATIRDFTEQLLAERRQFQLMEELKQSAVEARQQHALFRSVFESAPGGIVLTDKLGRVTMVNPALRHIFDYDSADLVGVPVSIFFADAEKFKLIDLWKAEEPTSVNCRRKDGEYFPGEITTVPYYDSEGEQLGYLGLIRDVSADRKREEGMRQAQRLEALGRLTGGIAHDLNNLLTVITGNLQLIEMDLKEKRLRRYLGEAERAAEMGARLNNRLMTFGRQRQLTPVATNLNVQIRHVIELLRRTIGEDIAINTSLAGDLWPTLVDPSEIESVVLNLSINARDAMPNGGALAIKTKNIVIAENSAQELKELAAGSYVWLSVSDTGVGMSQDVLSRAFEPFFSTKEPGKGTGLGLPSVYGFVKQSGGHVRLFSKEGHGTTADIYLPKLESAVGDSSKDETIHALDGGAGQVILIVEDNENVRRATVERLKRLGYEVLEADTGRTALAVMDTREVIDLVFSDVIMPDKLSGFDLAHKIRETRPSQRILLTSGYVGEIASADDKVSSFPMLRKPYSMAELGRAVRSALGA